MNDIIQIAINVIRNAKHNGMEGKADDTISRERGMAYWPSPLFFLYISVEN
jgi:hypothetical protein